MKKLIINILILFGVISFSSVSSAEDGAIKFTNTVMKEIVEKNKKGEDVISYIEPGLALPGNTMLYTITFENISNQPVSGIVVNDPLPNNSKYLANTATGRNTDITFSADGENFAVPGKLILTDKSGRSWTASADSYTHIRWKYKQTLKPGWQVVMPSNAEDAAGLLRYALRDNNPTIFFAPNFSRWF